MRSPRPAVSSFLQSWSSCRSRANADVLSMTGSACCPAQQPDRCFLNARGYSLYFLRNFPERRLLQTLDGILLHNDHVSILHRCACDPRRFGIQRWSCMLCCPSGRGRRRSVSFHLSWCLPHPERSFLFLPARSSGSTDSLG